MFGYPQSTKEWLISLGTNAGWSVTAWRICNLVQNAVPQFIFSPTATNGCKCWKLTKKMLSKNSKLDFCQYHFISKFIEIINPQDTTIQAMSGEKRLYRICKQQRFRQALTCDGPRGILTLVLLSPDIPCLCKQCRSRSVGFWRSGSQLIWICTVCHQVCEFIVTLQIKQSDWLKIRNRCGILIYSAGQGLRSRTCGLTEGPGMSMIWWKV